jgi:phage-related tail protein
LAALLAGFALTAAPLSTGDAAAASKNKASKETAEPTKAALPSAKSAAAPAKVADPEAIAAKRDPQYTSATTENGTGTDAGCLRLRKRLWVEGDGWLVRKVTVCP